MTAFLKYMEREVVTRDKGRIRTRWEPGYTIVVKGQEIFPPTSKRDAIKHCKANGWDIAKEEL